MNTLLVFSKTGKVGVGYRVGLGESSQIVGEVGVRHREVSGEKPPKKVLTQIWWRSGRKHLVAHLGCLF